MSLYGGKSLMWASCKMTGKTHMLNAAREVWENSGYRVKGATLSGIAAQGLERGAGIESRTVARRLIDWENGRDTLGKKDILVIDEAGMLGTKDVARLVGEVEERGAKLVMIGDPQQLQAIEAGAAFRGIAERTGYLEMNDIKRQEAGWQRDATKMFAMGEVSKALEQYEKCGKVHKYSEKEWLIKDMVCKWGSDRISNPEKTQIMLAYRKEDVRKLNEEARRDLKNEGMIKNGYEFSVSNGNREFSKKDQIYFLRNDNDLGVKNGTLGEVISVNKKGDIEVNIKGGEKDRKVSFNIEKYNHIDHGYASTVHKAQGITVDRAYVMASKGYNQHIAYVAMSRHIGEVNLYWSKDEFNSFEDLKNQFGREARKENAMDYISCAKEYAEGRGIESNYKEIGIRGFYKLYNQEKIEERFKYDFGDKKYDNIMDRLESRRVYNKDLAELKQFYGKGLEKELEAGDSVKYLWDKQIGDKNYAIFKAGEGDEYRMMERNRCIGIRQDEEVSIYKARDGGLAGTPSQEALWERKVSGLSDEFGKEVSFGAEIGDRGKYGGEIEFEGKRYGVMHQYDEVKLINKRDFAENFNVKEGGYMKIEQYREDKNEIIAVRDTAKYKEIEMNKQQEMEMKMDKGKDRGFEIEM